MPVISKTGRRHEIRGKKEQLGRAYGFRICEFSHNFAEDAAFGAPLKYRC